MTTSRDIKLAPAVPMGPLSSRAGEEFGDSRGVRERCEARSEITDQLHTPRRADPEREIERLGRRDGGLVAYCVPSSKTWAPWMACSGIGITRCLQTTAELNRDRHGLRWAKGTGPADVHVVVLRADQPQMRERADRLARSLAARQISVLIDDRPLPAGDKLRYARLLGLPHAAVLSPDHPDTEIEVIARTSGRTTRTDLSHIPDKNPYTPT